MLDFERVEEGLQTITLTKKQKDALLFFINNYNGSKFYYTMNCVACYVANREPFFINRTSEKFVERNVSRRQVDRCINWLIDNEFIYKIKEAKRPHQITENEETRCALYMPMCVGFFKWFRSFLNTRQLFIYSDKDDYQPDLQTKWGIIDMNFIQSLQQSLNNKLLTLSGDSFPLINFTIRQKDLDFMMMYGASGRASSDYCNEKSEEHLKDYELDKVTRQKILTKKWNCNLEDIKEFDVKASIPHIARLMNFNEWSQDDLYDVMSKDIFKTVFNISWNKELRDDSKHLFMLLAFNNDDSISKKTRNINHYIFKNEFLPYLNKRNIKFTNDITKKFKEKVTEYCGYVPNNIFVVESSIYLCFLWVLVKNGYFPKGHFEFVFDAIETNENIDVDKFNKILNNVTNVFVNKFMNHNFDPVFTLNEIIKDIDYNKYNLMWNTTENHYSKVFGDSKPINDESILILDKEYNYNGSLIKLYFKKGAKAAEEKLRQSQLHTKTLTELGKDLKSIGLDKQSLGIDKQSLGIDSQSKRLDKQSIERKQRDKTVLNEIKQLLEENPTIKMKEIEEKLGISKKYRQKLMKII